MGMLSLDRRKGCGDMTGDEGAAGEPEEGSAAGTAMRGQGGNGYRLKEGKFWLDIGQKFFCCEGGENLAQAFQRS